MPSPGDAGKALAEALFAEPEFRAYAILDGARNLNLLTDLERLGVRPECLFPGALEPEVLVTAPHLAPLSEGGALWRWIGSGKAGADWGVFLATRAEVLHVAAHFHRISLAALPDGRVGYFRYYDPRVLRRLLPSCTPDQRGALFGDTVARFVVENEPGAEPALLRFDA